MANIIGTGAAELIRLPDADWSNHFPAPPLSVVPLATDDADSIDAGGGDDVVISGDGADTINGGDGHDFIGPGWFFPGFGGAVVVDTDSNLGDEFDVLGGDVLNGGEGNDTIVAGYDTHVDGGAGSDVIHLSLDVMYVHFVAHSIIDTFNDLGITVDLSVAASATIVLPIGGVGDLAVAVTNVEAFNILFGWGNDNVGGGALSDDLNGNSGEDTIDGASGDDRLDGGLDADLVSGGEGNDTVAGYAALEYEDKASDTLTGGGGDDSLVGGLRDHLDGGAGFDVAEINLGSSMLAETIDLRNLGTPGGLVFAAGNSLLSIESLSRIWFGKKSDEITADTATTTEIDLGGGSDILRLHGSFDSGTRLGGGAGNDRLILDGDFSADPALDSSLLYGFETIKLTAGHDYWLASQLLFNDLPSTIDGRDLGLDDTLRFDGTQLSARLTVRGGDGADSLYGGAGRDTLLGSDGNDLIQGNRGADQATGGAGADAFRFDAPGGGIDVISDFASGLDRIEVSRAGFRHGLKQDMDLGATGRFVEGSAAIAARAQFLYDSTTGLLSWDADGTGTGQAVGIALLGAGATLLASDIDVIA